MRMKLAVLAVLAALVAVPAAGAQEYRFSVPKMQVVLTVKPDGSLVIDYEITFQNAPGAHPIDVVDVGMPTKNYAVISASVDGHPLSNWPPSTYIDVGPEVHLDAYAIAPGGSGVLKCRAVVTDMVFEDRTDSQRASVRFTPTWFGDKYVVGETDLLLVVKFPPGVHPDNVVWHSNSPHFFQKGVLEPDNVAFVSWTAHYRLTGPMMFGCSFPRNVMQHVVKSSVLRDALLWWKQSKRAQTWSGAVFLVLFAIGFLALTRGTGITVLLVCIGIFIFAMVKSPLLHLCLWPVMLAVLGACYAGVHHSKRHYMPAIAQGEGGKVCRGLTAAESAVLLERPLPQVLTLIITDLLNKGAIRAADTDPLTVDAAGKRVAPNIVQAADGTRMTLEPYEVGFLDALLAGPKEVAGKDFGKPLEKLVGLVRYKLAGFDVDATRAYYREVSERAWDRVSTEQDPAKKDGMANQWFNWLCLADDYDDRMERQRQSGWFFTPRLHWWPRRTLGHTWFRDMSRSLDGVAQRSAQALGGPHLKVDLSGVDRFTLDTLSSLADSAGSGGCAGGGCACAGCACACACAGGGR